MAKDISKMKSRLYDALESGNANEVRELLEAGLDPNAEVYGTSPLWLAAQNDRLECARLLLEAGADPNLVDSNPYSQPPLFVSAEQGHSEMVRLFLDHDARTYRPCKNQTVLESALANAGSGEIVRMLVEKGCAPDEPGPFGATPLQSAWKADVVEALIEAGADRTGCHPIHLAAERGQCDDIVGLIAIGFDPSAKNGEGDTPLHRAASFENPEACLVLIDAGADIHARDAKGREPSGVAKGDAKAVLLAAEEREWMAAETVATPQQGPARRRI